MVGHWPFAKRESLFVNMKLGEKVNVRGLGVRNLLHGAHLRILVVLTWTGAVDSNACWGQEHLLNGAYDSRQVKESLVALFQSSTKCWCARLSPAWRLQSNNSKMQSETLDGILAQKREICGWRRGGMHEIPVQSAVELAVSYQC